MPRLLVMLLASLAVGAEAGETPRCEDAVTTIEINRCLAEQLEGIEAENQRYLQRARDQAQEDPQLLAAIDTAQTHWEAYRFAECGAQYSKWRGGTIRTSIVLRCEQRLTRERTHTLWRHYLTYVDSTPPLLPEPPRD